MVEKHHLVYKVVLKTTRGSSYGSNAETTNPLVRPRTTSTLGHHQKSGAGAGVGVGADVDARGAAAGVRGCKGSYC